MPSQKLPLFSGIIYPVHNGVPGVAASPLVVATPLDKGLLPRGTQAYYEVHLWMIPGYPTGVIADDNDEFYDLVAYPDDNPANYRNVWSGSLFRTFGGQVWAAPIKILDGYPLRGNVTLAFSASRNGAGQIDQYPEGVQLFGYYYRVGEGTQIRPERRFIGEPSPDADNVSQGLPLALPANEKKILHYFEKNRIDEMSLAWAWASASYNPATVTYVELTFEDENNNPLIAGHKVSIVQFLTPPGTYVDPGRNFLRDPQSAYSVKNAVFGGGFQQAYGLPVLHHLSIKNASSKGDLYAHGYFTRR